MIQRLKSTNLSFIYEKSCYQLPYWPQVCSLERCTATYNKRRNRFIWTNCSRNLMISLRRWLPGQQHCLSLQQNLALNFKIIMVEEDLIYFMSCFILFIDSYEIKVAVPVTELEIIGINVSYIWFHFCWSWGMDSKGVAGGRRWVFWTAALGRNAPAKK